MPELVDPHPRYRATFLDAMAEFRAEGRGSPEDASAIGNELRTATDEWISDEAFAAYTARVVADRLEASPRPEGWVPATTLWWADPATAVYHGRVQLRHRLNDYLLDQGGHVGYDVRSSSRRRGYATAMLRGVLPLARDLGLDRVLVTCDDTNVASRRVIETCGGQLEDQRGTKLRFWVPTGNLRVSEASRVRIGEVHADGASR